MSSITVAQFAIELKMPSNVLLEQLREAGVNLTSVDASVTESDKAKLLESLRRSHGATEGTKITLTRRKTSEIRQADGAGRSRTIQVEVRKKRTFVKRDEAPVAIRRARRPGARARRGGAAGGRSARRYQGRRRARGGGRKSRDGGGRRGIWRGCRWNRGTAAATAAATTGSTPSSA